MDALENDDYNVIDAYAVNHIAFFLVWIIQNGFYTADAPEDILEAVDAVKNENMTGTEFLLQYCDGVLSREDLSPEIRGFADFYYDPDYLGAYTSFVEDELQKTVLGGVVARKHCHKKADFGNCFVIVGRNTTAGMPPSSASHLRKICSFYGLRV